MIPCEVTVDNIIPGSTVLLARQSQNHGGQIMGDPILLSVVSVPKIVVPCPNPVEWLVLRVRKFGFIPYELKFFPQDVQTNPETGKEELVNMEIYVEWLRDRGL